MSEWRERGEPRRGETKSFRPGISEHTIHIIDRAKTKPEKTVPQQLSNFFSTAQHLDRKLLMDTNIEAYVRRNRRDIGEPTSVRTYIFDREEKVWKPGNPLLSTVDCLDIADIARKRGSTVELDIKGKIIETNEKDVLAPWEFFIKRAIEECPWPAIYVDNIGDPDIEKWFTEQENWWQLSDQGPRRSHSFFTWTK